MVPLLFNDLKIGCAVHFPTLWFRRKLQFKSLSGTKFCGITSSHGDQACIILACKSHY